MNIKSKTQTQLEEAYQKVREATSYGPTAGAAARAETNPGIVGKDGNLLQGGEAMDKAIAEQRPPTTPEIEQAALNTSSEEEFVNWLQAKIPNIHPNVIKDLVDRRSQVLAQNGQR